MSRSRNARSLVAWATFSAALVIALSNGEGTLRFSVTDDGRGFDANAASYGTGLQGIADRLAAIGGTLTVTSTPGADSMIAGTIPVEVVS